MSDDLDKKVEDLVGKISELRIELADLKEAQRKRDGELKSWGKPKLGAATSGTLKRWVRLSTWVAITVDRLRFVTTEAKLSSMVSWEKTEPFEPPSRYYRKDIGQSRILENEEYIKALRWEQAYQFGPRAFEEDIRLTWRLLRKARLIRVEIPVMYEDTDDGQKVTSDWYETDQSLTTVLTDDGVRKLRRRLRKEQRERWAVLVPAITAITGLIGVIIGLASILR